MADLPAPSEGFVLTQFFVVRDVKKSAEFYQNVLGGEVVREGEPTMLKVANSWVILNVGGAGTDDKPDVYLEAPTDTHKYTQFMNVRVADIHQAYQDWKAKGAEFITEPKEHTNEWRCYMRDPDGHLIEVGQMKQQ